MKFVSFIVIGFSVVLTTACGPAGLREKTTALGQQGPTTDDGRFDAETAYLNMPAPDYTVTFTPTLYGSSTTQRQTADRFCRKVTVTAPNAQPTYACWERNREFVSPETMFQYLAAYYSYGVSIGMVGGSMEEAITSDGSIICRKSTPVVPHPTSTYECFSEM